MTATGAPAENRPRLARATFVVSVAALGGFLFGYDSSVINGAVTAIQEHFHVGAGTTGLVVSSTLLGCAAGASAAGRLADRWGRTRIMLVAAALFVIGGLGSALPFSVWDLTAWRVVAGVAIGIASVVSPAYIGEVSPASYRGRMTSVQQLAIVGGIFISQLVNYGIAELAGGDSLGRLLGLQAWQWMLGVSVVPAVIYFVLALTLPESPRYQIMTGRADEARRTLARLEGGDIEARVREITETLRLDRRPRLRDLRGGALGLMPVVWIGIGLCVLQQFVGVNVIFYYSSMLWQSVGINQSSSLLISVSTSIVNIVGTLAGMALIDRVGRKPLAVAGCAGMTLSLAACSWAFGYAHHVNGSVTIPDAQGTVALVGAHIFVFSFAVSWGVVIQVLLGEIFPNRVRAAGISVAFMTQWLANWAVTVSFPDMAQWNLSATYGIYTVFGLASVIFAVFCIRETRGRKLEEMG